MRTFQLDKLVRDNIVPFTKARGGSADYELLEREALQKALVEKIIEEAKELQDGDLSVDELADLQEIIDELTTQIGSSRKQVAEKQAKKRTMNGGFSKGHYVKTVTLPAENKWAKYYASNPERFPEVI